MTTVTATVTVNAAFFQEVKEDNRALRELLDAVRGVFAGREWSHDAVQRRSACALLAQLRDQLAMHFALEEAYGYFDQPMQVAPRLCHQADTLRSQHGELYLSITSLADDAETLLAHHQSPAALRSISERFGAFDERLARHETEENDLIQEALEQDIGVGD